jgi:hypothetical protein
VTRITALLCLSLGLLFTSAAQAKDKGERYTCSYCNSLQDPVSCCWKVKGCETFESAGGKACRQKVTHAPKGKPLEPYKPMGLAKKTPKRQPTFSCEHCNSVTNTASCCHKLAGCAVVDRAGGRVCKKAE